MLPPAAHEIAPLISVEPSSGAAFADPTDVLLGCPIGSDQTEPCRMAEFGEHLLEPKAVAARFKPDDGLAGGLRVKAVEAITFVMKLPVTYLASAASHQPTDF